MSYRFEKPGDIVIEGFEQGIASSPHKGIANIQGGNISTEIGEVMCSYNRVAQLTSAGTSGTLTPITNSTVSFSPSIAAGSWFTITADSGTGLSGNYYYLGGGQISQSFTGAPVTNILTNPITTIFLTSGTTWSVPSDWNSAYNSIEVIGAGGDGSYTAGQTGSGGGGGAYSKITNLTLTPSSSITYQIGANGAPATDTYFNGASLAASSVGAQGGRGGTSALGFNAGGLGGQASAGVGTVTYSGGSGGDALSTNAAAGAGGGAAGPNGAGGDGSDYTGTLTGGNGDSNLGGAGGTTTATDGNPGGAGTEYDGTHGSGGGGGATNNTTNTVTGGAGGLYGGGGAGASYPAGNTAGLGAQGLIVIKYSPVNPVTTSATYSARVMGAPIQSATEPYKDTSNILQTRYYILDSLGVIWVHDTAITSPIWFSPQSSVPNDLTGLPSGLAVLNGWVSYILPFSQGSFLFWRSTSMLGIDFDSLQPVLTSGFHATLTSSSNIMYYTDGNIVGSIFPNNSPFTIGVNLQSYCSWTAPTFADNTIGQVSAIIGGSAPYISVTDRLPVVFFTPGTLPASIVAGSIYYIQSGANANTRFQVYANQIGGSPLDITTGASGTQYFNTFYPVSPQGAQLLVFSPENLFLPFYETSISLARLGSTIIVGCTSNNLYSWDGISSSPSDVIPLSENNAVNMITVNSMLYVFAGQKGNIYICNGSSASLALSVPDFCAGIAGTPNSYIEPYFQWGGAMFVRGRIWFSILDQTTTKTGNCGGIWSFTPTNNLYIGQDTGIALRLENQSSYGTYNGVSTVLIPSQNQLAIGVQYWSAWYSSITAPSYGIDFTDVIPESVSIETDLIPTGTLLNNKTFEQIEYKLATPLASGETVQIYYRNNSTAAYQICGTIEVESATELSGYYRANFQNTQWLQLKIILTPLASTSSSFVRLKEVRIR